MGFPGVTYGSTKTTLTGKSYDYSCPKTIGFYQLNRTMRKIGNVVNTYVMVGNANAPTPLYDVDTSTWTDDDWSNSENLKKVADSLYLNNDNELFNDIDAFPLPESIQSIINTDYPFMKASKDAAYGWDNTRKKWIWKTLRVMNQAYHLSKTKNDDYLGIRTVLGYVSPYKTTNIVFGKREGWADLAKAWTDYKDSGYIVKETSSGDQLTKYLYILAVPFSGNAEAPGWRTAWSDWGSDPKKTADGETYAQKFKNHIVNKIIKPKVFGLNESDPLPAYWVEQIHLYSTTGVDVPSEHLDEWTPLSEQGKQWIDNHLCHMSQWGSAARRSEGKVCKFTLNENSVELIGVTIVQNRGESGTEFKSGYMSSSYHAALMSSIISGKSLAVQYSKWTNYSYAWTSSPYDFVTITYRDSNGNPTGTLKVITHPNKFVNSSKAGVKAKQVLVDGGYILSSYKVRSALFNQNPNIDIPQYWVDAIKYHAYKTYRPAWSVNRISTGKSMFSNPAIVRFVKKFYDSLKKALPLMLGYRYQSQILSKFVNKDGMSVVDYENENNNVVMKSIPVMDASDLNNVFNASFQGGNFRSGKKFPYDHCVVDLNPSD